MRMLLKDYLDLEVAKGALGRLRRRLFSESLDAVYLIRCMLYWNERGKRPLLQKLYRRRLIRRYGVSVELTARIGPGLRLPHPQGIVIGYRVRMGKNAGIYQNVTFGALRDGDTSAGRLPVVGDGCTFFSGCCVLGGITVADGTVVGANAVLTRSTERGGTYAGLPARRVDGVRAAGEGCA